MARTHSQIVADIGPEKLAELRSVSVHTARSWAQRNAIPPEHWLSIASSRLATLKELAVAAAAKPRKRPNNAPQTQGVPA